SEMMRSLIEKRGTALAHEFILERRKERLEYGETVYLLEPNVKRSRGGLRDIHLLRWLWYLKAGVADPDRLHDMGVVSKFDHRRWRISRRLEPLLGRKMEADYQIGKHEVSATPRATARLEQHPEEVLKLVDLARREGKRISQDTWHFVYRTAPKYSNDPKPAI